MSNRQPRMLSRKLVAAESLLAFDGTDDQFIIPHDEKINIGTALESWAYSFVASITADTTGTLFSKIDANGKGVECWYNSADNKVYCRIGDVTPTIDGNDHVFTVTTEQLELNRLYKFFILLDFNNREFAIYTNGQANNLKASNKVAIPAMNNGVFINYPASAGGGPRLLATISPADAFPNSCTILMWYKQNRAHAASDDYIRITGDDNNSVVVARSSQGFSPGTTYTHTGGTGFADVGDAINERLLLALTINFSTGLVWCYGVNRNTVLPDNIMLGQTLTVTDTMDTNIKGIEVGPFQQNNPDITVGELKVIEEELTAAQVEEVYLTGGKNVNTNYTRIYEWLLNQTTGTIDPDTAGIHNQDLVLSNFVTPPANDAWVPFDINDFNNTENLVLGNSTNWGFFTGLMGYFRLFQFDDVFVSSWNTNNTSTGSSTSTQVKLPLVSLGSYNFVVDWGDGNQDTITAWNQAETTHTYSVAGTYTIRIRGTINGWGFDNTGDRLKILNIQKWGTVVPKTGGLTSGEGFMYGCQNLTVTATDELSLTGVTDLTNAFRSTAVTTIPNIGKWDMSGITSIVGMFANSSFNDNVSGWNFGGASVNLLATFLSNTAFNQDISGWNLLPSTMQQTFSGATAFNQNINPWDVSGCITFFECFLNATSFNQPLSSWDITGSTSIASMFEGASAFNQDISSWTLTGQTTVFRLFRNATSFNQNISGWNTSTVANMQGMFRGATAFDQNIGGWNVTSVTNMTLMFDTVTLSTANYNSLLTGWEAQAVNNSVVFNAGSSTYTQTSVDSGTTDSTVAGKLVQSGQNFLTTVSIGDIVHNTTDNVFSKVTNVDSDTVLSISNDNCPTGKAYVIQSSAEAKARFELIDTHLWTITDGGAV